jgi:hypothetical protein
MMMRMGKLTKMEEDEEGRSFINQLLIVNCITLKHELGVAGRQLQ